MGIATLLIAGQGQAIGDELTWSATGGAARVMSSASARSKPTANPLQRFAILNSFFVFTLALIGLFLAMDRRIDPYDEGFMLTSALTVSAGEFPHQDFYFLYGPATPWLLSKLWTASPYSFIAGRLYGLAIQAGVVAVSYYLIGRLKIGWPGKVATCAIWLWLAALQNHLYPSFSCILLCLIASSMFLHQTSHVSRWQLLLAGAIVGAAAMFRYDAGAAIAAAMTAYIVLAGIFLHEHRRLWPDVTYDSLTFIGGVSLSLAPMAYHYVRADLVHVWWQDVAVSSLTYYISHRSLPFPGLLEIIRRPSWVGVFLAPLTIALVAVTCWHRPPAKQRYRDDLCKRKFVVLMCCLSAALYYKGLVRVQPLHAIMSIVPATLLLAVCAAEWRNRSAHRAAAVAASLLLLMLMLLPPAYAFASAMHRLAFSPSRITGIWLATAAPRLSTPNGTVANARDALFGADMLPGQYAATEFIRRHSAAEDRIFVANSRHDRFLINSVALYFMADRLPGTRWFIFDPGLQTRSDIQALIIGDLQLRNVRWIVMDDVDDHVREPNQSSVSSGVSLLDCWIARHYHRVTYTRPSSVWLRNTGNNVRGLE